LETGYVGAGSGERTIPVAEIDLRKASRTLAVRESIGKDQVEFAIAVDISRSELTELENIVVGG